MSDDIFKARRQRARDIYDERGYTTRQFARLAGLGSHVEVMRYLNEKQPNNKEPKDITTPVLEKFLSAFKITLERFERTDTIDLISKLKLLLESGKNPKEALRFAQVYVELAVGVHEKSEALGLLGKAYYELDMQEEAHETIRASYELALKGQDRVLIYEATNKLLHSLYTMGRYEECEDLLNTSESNATGDVRMMGTFKHFRGLIASRRCEYDISKDYYSQAYDLYRITGDKSLIGRIEVSLAHHEYHDGNYNRAYALLMNSMENLLESTLSSRIVSALNLARVLIQTNREEEASELIIDQLRLIDEHELEKEDLKGKLLLMLADISNDTNLAKEALTFNSISEELKFALIDFLTIKSIEAGDLDGALKYYRLVKDNFKSCTQDYRLGRWF